MNGIIELKDGFVCIDKISRIQDLEFLDPYGVVRNQIIIHMVSCPEIVLEFESLEEKAKELEKLKTSISNYYCYHDIDRLNNFLIDLSNYLKGSPRF